jgi:precorrin isomerase
VLVIAFLSRIEVDSVVVIGEDPQALKNYREHPDHQKIALIIEEMELDGIGFDFDDNA